MNYTKEEFLKFNISNINYLLFSVNLLTDNSLRLKFKAIKDEEL